jgi:3-phenylpropionate/trans-cinnamate dioxygenase ferredoxin reductase subunit
VPIRRVVVAGASVAGVRAAESLREQGFAGELIVLDGDKELPYNRPPLSKELLAGELDEDDIRLLTPDLIADMEIDLRLGTMAAELRLDDRAVVTDRETIGFDALVIATGAVPVIPRGWTELAGVTALRTLDDARAIRAALRGGSPRVVVVGGGFIGCEIAASVQSLGAAEVTIIEAGPGLLTRVLHPLLAEPIARLHQAHGVSIRCGTPVASLLGSGRVEAVELADGSRINADLVVVGLGARPAVQWLASSGLPVKDGVRADATLRVAPGVYAAGDVVQYADRALPGGRRAEHWTSAREHGVIAAGNLLNPAQQCLVSGPAYVWSDQYGSRIQIIGSGSGEEIMFVENGGPEGGYLALVGSPERVTGAIALDRSRQFRRGRRLIENGADWVAVRNFPW